MTSSRHATDIRPAPARFADSRRLLVFLALAALAHGGLWWAWQTWWQPPTSASASGTLRVGLVVAAPVRGEEAADVPAAPPAPREVSQTQAAQTTDRVPPDTTRSERLSPKAEPAGSAGNLPGTLSDNSADRGRAASGTAELVQLRDSWYADVNARLARDFVYPYLARMRELEGVVVVRFSLGRSGELVSSTLLASSGHGLLDRAAQALVVGAAPFPAPPSSLPAEALTLQVPITFSLPR